MKNLSHKAVEQAIRHFSYIAEYLKVPTNESENQRLIELVHQLKAQIKIKKEASTVELLDLLIDNIELYEKQAYPLSSMKPTEILSFLIEQHQLTQSDLPEIGSQSHVSKVLHGKRQLTLEQIIALSKRFSVSPIVFFSH
jgi:HTH-type transcriptional regulator / antitoxin HigA